MFNQTGKKEYLKTGGIYNQSGHLLWMVAKSISPQIDKMLVGPYQAPLGPRPPFAQVAWKNKTICPVVIGSL